MRDAAMVTDIERTHIYCRMVYAYYCATNQGEWPSDLLSLWSTGHIGSMMASGPAKLPQRCKMKEKKKRRLR